MNFISTKKSSDIKLAGIVATVDATDSSVNCITLTDAEGKMVRIAMRSYSLTVEVPAPPKMVKRHRVAGKVFGLSVNELFEHLSDAQDRRDNLIDHGTVELDEVEITEDEAEIAAKTADEELPF